MHNVELLKFYITKGIDINAKTLEKITYFDKTKKLDGDNFLEMLASQHSVYAAQSTPLACAADYPGDSALAFVKILVEHGADVNAVDADGKTILSRTRNPKVREYLMREGAK